MLSFVRFSCILQTSAFAVLLSMISVTSFAECDGIGTSLTTGPSDSRPFDGEGGIASIISGADTSRKVNSADNIPTYLLNQDWYVQFEDGVVHGYSGCAARSVKLSSAPYSYTAFTTSAYSGCLCSLTENGNTWYPVNMSDSKNANAVESGSDWVAKNTYCRQYCAQTCAEHFANDTNNLRTAMVNNYGSCPVVASTPPQPTTYTITYDLQGGTGCNASDTYNNGQSATICTPTREGYDFDGWMDINTYDIYDGGDIVLNTDLTLEASWTFIGCGAGYYYANNTCNSCATDVGDGYTSISGSATSIYDCTISATPGTYLVPNVNTGTTGGYTYVKDGDGYTQQSEFNDAESNSWRVFFDYGNLSGRAACSDIWAEYGSVNQDTEFSPTQWYGYNCWCDIEQYGNCTTSNRTECSNEITMAAKSKWVSFGYVENDRCWQDCAGKCANAIEQNQTFRTNALSTIKLQITDCPAGSYCPNTITTNYGNMTASYNNRFECPEQYPDSDPRTTDESNCYKSCEEQSGFTVSGVDYKGITDTCVYTPITYTITYNNNGGEGCSNTNFTVENSATICTPTRNGYRFDGWIDTVTTNIYTGGETAPLRNLNLEAQWTQLYTITYVLGDGGTGCENETFTNTATVCSDPTREGYTFDGWTTTPDGEMEYIGDEIITKTNLTLYAIWIRNEPTLTYISYCDSDYETDLDITEISASDSVTFPTDLSSCPKNSNAFYEYNNWICANSIDATETVTVSNGSQWNANFYDADCYPNWVKKPTLTVDFYCDEYLADDIDSYEFLPSSGLTFPSPSSCAQTDSYVLSGWICENASDPSQTVEFGDVQHASWNANFNDMWCYATWAESVTPTWNCVDGEVNTNSDNYYPRGSLDSVQEINRNTYYEFDGDEYLLLTGQSNSWNLSHALVAKNSNDTGSYAYQQYMAELDYYTSDQSWSVTFGNTTISGIAVCAARGWGEYMAENKNIGSSLQGVLTGTFVGCACSLDKERWIGAGKLDTTTNAWETNNTFCRKNCPAECARYVATEKEFRDALFNGVCPTPSNIEPITECDDGKFLYDNTCVDSCDDRFEYEGVCYATCPSGTYKSGTACVTTCGENDMIAADECKPSMFTVVTTPDTTYFEFTISASGTFYIDCGNGTPQSFSQSSPGVHTISCSWSEQGAHKIKIRGNADGYSEDASMPAIGFGNIVGQNNTASKVAGIYGSLGSIFPSVGSGDTTATQPRFYRTFHQCVNLESEIPTNLFSGIIGKPVEYMFFATFMECPKLSGTIPAHLFNGISGKPEMYTFDGIFSQCSSLEGEIPATLFENIRGELDGSEKYLFAGTFYNCSGLTGTIPESLFSGISGVPTESMFNSTFYGCSGLSGSLPQHLFDTIRGPLAKNTFDETFMQEEEYAGTGVSGFVPVDFFKYITNDNNVSNGMTDIFTNSAIATECPADYYKVDTIFEEYLSGRVSCAQCPSGTYSSAGATSDTQCCPAGQIWNGEACERTDFVCESGKWLHLGDNAKLCLSETKPLAHESPIVINVQIGNDTYYLNATPGMEYLPVNEDSINTKMKVLYNGRTYNVHDNSVSSF